MAFMASFITMLCLCSAVADPTETCGSTSDDTSLLQKKTKVSNENLMSMPSSKAAEPTCTDKCSSLGHMNNNPNTGSDQIISCSQACMIRSRGSSKTECETNCNRNGQSGCSLNVNGHSYSMCAAREDYSAEALTKLVHNDACRDGCSMVASIEPAPCNDFSTEDDCPENCVWIDEFGCKDPNGTVDDLGGNGWVSGADDDDDLDEHGRRRW